MQTIGGAPREEILAMAEEVFRRFLVLKENPKPERTGGYFTILNKVTDQRYFINEIGHCLPEMDFNCFRYTQEKSQRVSSKSWGRDGHFSAWQSRDRGRHEYGGCIIAPMDSKGLEAGRNLIGAFSGTTEHGEEAFLMVLWTIFGWITVEDAEKIITISGNPLYAPLMVACGDLLEKEYAF